MSARLSVFDHPFFLGFDHFERELNRLKKNGGDGYPPYNVEQIGEDGLRISLAVAGFTMDDLDVEVENNQLTIRGQQHQDDDGRVFLHRGIAGRQFQRSFVLADGIEVKGASLDSGLLHIDMIRVQPESAARKIEITNGKHSANGNGSGAQVIDVDDTAALENGKRRSRSKKA